MGSMSDSEWMMATMVMGIMVLFVSILLCFLFAFLDSIFAKEEPKCEKKAIITKPMINSPVSFAANPHIFQLDPTLNLPTDRKQPSSGTVTVEMESVMSDGLDDWSDSLSDSSSNSSNMSARTIFGEKNLEKKIFCPLIEKTQPSAIPPAVPRLSLSMPTTLSAVPSMVSTLPQMKSPISVEKTPLFSQKSLEETIVEMEKPPVSNVVIPAMTKSSTLFPTTKIPQTIPKKEQINPEKPTNQTTKNLPVKSLGLVDIPLNGNRPPVVHRSVVSTGTPDKRFWLPYALPSAAHRSVFNGRNEMSPKRESETAAERPISAKPTRR